MQGNDSFRLVVRRGPQPNQTYDLNKDIITVGRDITNDIVINDPEVSRHHMRFTRGAGGFTIEDLGSTNGTFVNGQRLTGAKPLNNGDMVGLGETVTLGYEVVRPAAADGPAPTVSSPAQQPQQPTTFAPPSDPADPAPSPYASPQPQQEPQPSFSPPPAQPSYASQQEPGYGSEQPSYTSPPPQPVADPYYPEYEEPPEGRNTLRIVLIGCVSLSVFCCCATVAALVIIDQNCLWDQIPVLSDVLNAFGFYATCA